MPTSPMNEVLQHLRTTLVPEGADRTDGQLLECFLSRGEPAALEALVRRHAPMVWGVCRRVLGDHHDAEDALQATFLVLVRKAASVSPRAKVGNWLYGVAHQTALKARARRAKRTERERPMTSMPEPAVIDRDACADLHPVLDREVSRLPEHYRTAIVLCELGGRTVKEVARQLGCPEGTVASRLARGRALLAKRLARHGLAVTTATLAAVLSREAAAAMPASVLTSTIKVVTAVAAGPAANGVVSVTAAALTDRVIKAMLLNRLLKLMLVLLAVAGLSGAAELIYGTRAAELPKAGDRPPAPETAAETRPSSPDGAIAAAPSGEGLRADWLGDPLPSGAVARLGTSRLRGQRCLFLPDGRRVVREWDGQLQISEFPSGKPLALIRSSDDTGLGTIMGSSIALSPDGKYLAAVCRNGRSGVWETATGKLVRCLESGSYSSCVRCDFSPDGKLLAVEHRPRPDTIDDSTVVVFEIDSGRRLFSVLGTNSTFAADGRALVAWHAAFVLPPKAHRVAVPTGQELTTLDLHHSWVAYTPSDGALFFDVEADGDIRVLDMAAAKCKFTLRGPKTTRHGEPIWVRHTVGRAELIAVGGKPAGIWCWEKETGRLLWQTPLKTAARGSVLSLDGKTLVTSESSGQVRVWEVATGRERSSFHPAAIGHEAAVARSPMAWIDGELTVIDEWGSFPREAAVAVSPDGKTIATTPGGNFSTSLVFWDAATGNRLSVLPGHAAGITAAAFAPDGATVYTIGQDRTLRTWEAASGRLLSEVPAQPAASLAVAPDGKTLFAAGPDTGVVDVLYGAVEFLGDRWPRDLADAGVVRVLDARSGKEKRRFRAFRGPLHGLDLTADGRCLFAAGRDGQTGASLVRVFNAESGLKLREFKGSGVLLEQLAVRPDGTALATTEVGRRVWLWDGSGSKVREYVGRSRRQSAWTVSSRYL